MHTKKYDTTKDNIRHFQFIVLVFRERERHADLTIILIEVVYLESLILASLSLITTHPLVANQTIESLQCGWRYLRPLHPGDAPHTL